MQQDHYGLGKLPDTDLVPSAGQNLRCTKFVGKNFKDDTDLMFLSGFPAWAKL